MLCSLPFSFYILVRTIPLTTAIIPNARPRPPPTSFYRLSTYSTTCADIFDGDELTAADLKRDDIETAQYSCHVVGLVLSRSRNVFIADPNGALIPGGNMEFLSLPVLSFDFKPTTATSHYDRDVAAVKKKKSKKS